MGSFPESRDLVVGAGANRNHGSEGERNSRVHRSDDFSRQRGSLPARRRALSFLRSKAVVSKLFSDVASRFRDRPGGYTRIIRTRRRIGDAAEMVAIELVTRPEKPKAAPATDLAATEKKRQPTSRLLLQKANSDRATAAVEVAVARDPSSSSPLRCSINFHAESQAVGLLGLPGMLLSCHQTLSWEAL